MLFFLTTAFADPLPDLASTVSRAPCESPVSTNKNHPGAEQFYTGAFVVDESGNFTGVERRYTYANSSWKRAADGRDCVEVWTVTGTKVGDTLKVKADITKDTTCKLLLNSEANHFKTEYTLKEIADGSFELLFPSGKKLGKGQRTDKTYSWMSTQTCVWF